jgi:hypothetical protein
MHQSRALRHPQRPWLLPIVTAIIPRARLRSRCNHPGRLIDDSEI